MSSPFTLHSSCKLRSGAVTSIKYNHKGDQIAVSTSVGHLFIFSEEFSEPIIEFPPLDGPINQISWDFSSTYIFSVTEAGSIWRYDSVARTSMKVITFPKTSLLTCSSSPSSSYVAIGSTIGNLSIFKSENVQETQNNSLNNFISDNSIKTTRAHSDSVADISFRGDGLQLITCSYDTIVRIWGTDLICVQSFDFHIPILSVKFQYSGKLFYICCSDNTFKLISIAGNVKKNNVIDIKEGYIIGCSSMIGNKPDSTQSVVIGLNIGVIIFYAQKNNMSGEFQFAIPVQNSPFYAFDIHPKEAIMATGGGPNEMNLKIWKMANPNENDNVDENLNQFSLNESNENITDSHFDKFD